MKRFLKSMKSMAVLVAVIILVLCPFLLPTVSQAAPFRVPVTVNAGVGTYTITNVYSAAATGVQLSHVLYTCTAPATSTASFVVGNVTNAIGTKAITATDRLLLATNAPPFLIGDLVRLTSSDTNSHTAYLVGNEF